MLATLFSPVPVITAPAGSEVAVEAVFVPVYIQVELMVALTPWACHASERVSVNAGVVKMSILVAAVVAGSVVAGTASEVLDPVGEGKVDAEAAADAGCEEEDTAAVSGFVEVAARMQRSARAQRPNKARGGRLRSSRASSGFAIDPFRTPVDNVAPNKPIEYGMRNNILPSQDLK